MSSMPAYQRVSSPYTLERVGSSEDISFDSRIEWLRSNQLVPYYEALDFMEKRIQDIYTGKARELVWLLEHPSLYSAGSSAMSADLLHPGRLPVVNSGRGGQLTYHGPGQRIVYVMLDLRRRGQDVRKFIWQLEEWVIRALAKFGIKGTRHLGRVGVWIDTLPACSPAGLPASSLSARPMPEGTVSESAVSEGQLDSARDERKIAAIGIRIRHWITFHGLALNLDPDLSYYSGIVPCGLSDYHVTSMRALGYQAGIGEVDDALIAGWDGVFG